MKNIKKTISDYEIIRKSETFRQMEQLVKEMKNPEFYGIDVKSLGAVTLDYLEEISLSELKICIEKNINTSTPQRTLSLIRLHEDTFFRVLITNILTTKPKKDVDLKTLAIANLLYLNMIEEREKQDDPKSIEFMPVRLNPELVYQFYLCNKSFIRWFKCPFNECDYQHIPYLNNFEKDMKDLACEYFIHFADDEHKMGKEEILKTFTEILWIKKDKYNKLHPKIIDFIFVPTAFKNSDDLKANSVVATASNQNEIRKNEYIYNNSDESDLKANSKNNATSNNEKPKKLIEKKKKKKIQSLEKISTNIRRIYSMGKNPIGSISDKTCGPTIIEWDESNLEDRSENDMMRMRR